MSVKRRGPVHKTLKTSPRPLGTEGEANPWGEGTYEIALRPWDTRILERLPHIGDIGLFWQQMVEFVAQKVPQAGEAENLFDAAATADLVRSFCNSYFSEPVSEAACSMLAELVQSELDRRVNADAIRRLSALIAELGLRYVVTAADAQQYRQFASIYDIAHSGDTTEWLPGPELLQKWEVSPAQFAQRWNGLLPSYLWNRADGQFECVTAHVRAFRHFLENKSPDPSFPLNKQRPCMWFCVPQWRYFRREHVEFFEKTHPGFAKKYGPVYSLTWLSFSELMQRWLCKPMTIETVVRKEGLPAYVLNPVEGISRATDDDLTLQMEGGPPLKLICLFRLQEVQEFEVRHMRRRPRESLIGLSPVGHRRIRARDRAVGLHLQNGWNKSRIIDYFEEEYVFCNREYKPYSDTQIKRWLQGLQFAKKGTPRKHSLPKKNRS